MRLAERRLVEIHPRVAAARRAVHDFLDYSTSPRLRRSRRNDVVTWAIPPVQCNRHPWVAFTQQVGRLRRRSRWTMRCRIA